ncbi:MAG: methionine synthase [Anaerolineae bacterium]|nr:methionine synthase [Anaerolineae bacterium]MBT7191005.1 methionine synthase [Anaerolineae bacterium]MBT7989466.1 methionine synthase [Anaerolineae bacterium]
MIKTYTNRNYLDALNERVLIFDGAMGTSIQNQNLTAEDYGGEKYNGCVDYLVLTNPAAIEKVHRSFFDVGVDVVETDTFRANRLTLGEYGLADKTIELNKAAASLARRLADEYSTPEQPRFVAGSLGPTGKLPSADDPDLSDLGYDDLAELFREQATGLLEGGVDVLLIETSQDILEVKAAITGIQTAFAETKIVVPLQAQITLDTTGRMLFGTDIAAALSILEGLPIDVVGMNCSTGPEHMRAPIEFLGENANLPVSCIPNAGMPMNVDGEAVYHLEPEAFANDLYEFIEKNGISVVGGCCGTTPTHLKALVDKVHGTVPAPRPERSTPRLASGIRSFTMRQEPAPFIIGERCNAQGSRKFKRLLLEENWDEILEVARQQVDYGSHALDISVAVTEIEDEAGLMRNVVRKLVTSGIDVPLVFDTTDVAVMEAGLKVAPGRSMLNSTHLESGREKADKVFALAKKHNATVLVLTIDEVGMAKTAERKVEIAKTIHDIAVNDHGLKAEDLIVDALTFTLATGEAEYIDSAKDTIEGIKRIKAELPGVFTSLGVSNVSFGLSKGARPIINSTFLYHCVQAGLDMAIINPAHTPPFGEIPTEERELAEDLIFNKRPDALQRVIEHFEGREATALDTSIDPTEGMTLAERLHWRIVLRQPGAVGESASVENDVDEIIAGKIMDEVVEKKHDTAIEVLNNVLLPAMKEVGDKFGAGELILPFVLQSAEVMKKAVARLEQYLEQAEGTSKGKVVLATVYGDVHDIGKNLVKTILTNNGFDVVDLGKQVPAETIINAAIEENADAIGLSALLVSTSKQMPLIVNELHRRGQNIPVMLGGAAINRRFGLRINKTDDGGQYEAGAFYCKDAFEGLETMELLQNAKAKPALMEKHQAQITREAERAANAKSKPAGKIQRSKVVPNPISLPEKLGAKVVEDMPLEMVFEHLYKKELFRLSWGAKNKKGKEWAKLEAEFEARLTKMKKEAVQTGWLKPQGVYGFFPCQADDDELVIYNPENAREALTRFAFPRQPKGDNLCLADYFAPVGSEQMDVVAFQIVTVGQEATEKFDALEAAGDYSEAYFVHGLAVQTAEAAANYLHAHIQREMGIDSKQGKRYSWGYPAIPDLDDHTKVFELLPVEEALGMTLSAAYQLIPEQSTAAIVLHHVDAKYFTV